MKLEIPEQLKGLFAAVIETLSDKPIIKNGQEMPLSEKMITLGQALITAGFYGREDFDGIDKEG